MMMMMMMMMMMTTLIVVVSFDSYTSNLVFYETVAKTSIRCKNAATRYCHNENNAGSCREVVCIPAVETRLSHENDTLRFIVNHGRSKISSHCDFV
mmetsp:Transcript_22002/g.54449  ORF Transcript_22002/g.54449 Transcript_22002/m.54449 type:complete len:96 (+) Transcript_22002:2-289(+)